MIRYLALPFRVNNIIHKYDKDNIVTWGELGIFNVTTACLCLPVV